MKELSYNRLFWILFGFALISIFYTNCGGQQDSVITSRSDGLDILCDVNKVEKLSLKTDFSQLEGTSIFLTPTDGDWLDNSTDSLRNQQTYLDALAAEQAHQIVYSEITSAPSPVVVAVIDSGVDYNHPDLSQRILRQQGKIVGYDFYNNDTDPMDDNGHGTHIAGLIAAEGHNGVGLRGGAPEHVMIMPIKVMSNEGFLPSSRFGDFVKAIQFAVDNGAHVINMSLGATVNVEATNADQAFAGLRGALLSAVSKGVVVVLASGNDNIELNSLRMTYPAKFGSEIEGVITVGAYDTTVKSISPFSNFSPTYVEVQAPGSTNSGKGLISTWPGGNYKLLAGTSMATPLVSALVALTRIYLDKKGINLTPGQIEGLVKESSLEYQSLLHLAQEGRVINYRYMIDRLVQIYESGIIEHPVALQLQIGQTGRLAIRMNQFTMGLTFQWYHNGQAISGANKIDYLVRNFTKKEIGDYYVEVRLESGETVKSLVASVTEASTKDCSSI